ncbi:hypothetical protein NSA24_09810 [Clostridioides mangenotii]|uniref:hypothetical protein n=1 Tax=Metaclostridioides mangenotii TaxID=1540 RepID=UPI002149E23F|nr:hypothetical protein [Clostridioides mangenotii]MCR1955087.1 hypothetical protein [Clostridioides mangenotii]
MEYFSTIQLSHDFIIKTGNKSAFGTIKMTLIIPFKRPVMSILLNLNQSYYIIWLNLRNKGGIIIKSKLNYIDQKDLVKGKIVFYRKDEGSKGFIEDWDTLVNKYNLSLSKIADISHIDEIRLKNYNSGDGYLTYDEMSFLTTVIIEPFMCAINIAKENYITVTDTINKNISNKNLEE